MKVYMKEYRILGSIGKQGMWRHCDQYRKNSTNIQPLMAVIIQNPTKWSVSYMMQNNKQWRHGLMLCGCLVSSSFPTGYFYISWHYSLKVVVGHKKYMSRTLPVNESLHHQPTNCPYLDYSLVPILICLNTKILVRKDPK